MEQFILRGGRSKKSGTKSSSFLYRRDGDRDDALYFCESRLFPCAHANCDCERSAKLFSSSACSFQISWLCCRELHCCSPDDFFVWRAACIDTWDQSLALCDGTRWFVH